MKQVLWGRTQLKSLYAGHICSFLGCFMFRVSSVFYSLSYLFWATAIGSISVIGDVQAQTPQEAIKQQAGCYEVTFQYTETEAIQEGYKLKKPKKTSSRA